MSKKQILFVDDDPTQLQALKELMKDADEEWSVEFVASPSKALKLMAKTYFHVVFAALGMAGITGVEFLNQVWKRFPQTIRYLLAREVDHDLVTLCVLGTHQVLQRPLDRSVLWNAIRQALSVNDLVKNKGIKELVSKIRTFPSLPSVYFEVLRELGLSSASAQSIGALIGQDLGMTTKLIHMVNSAYFGMQRQISDPAEAVLVLGVETVKSLVLGIHAFSQYDKVKPLYFSIDRVWRHSNAVGNLAKRIVLMETGDEKMADEAYTAGLLHDIGKLILASNLEEQYRGALTLARDKAIPPSEVEFQVFGATHAETGAYLLSLWGLPVPIVEATALHHFPAKCSSKAFTPLTAIHVANVLEHQAHPKGEPFAQSDVNQDYLQSLGVLDRLESWRSLLQPESKEFLPLKKQPTPALPIPSEPPAKEVKKPLAFSNLMPVEAAAAVVAGLLILSGWGWWVWRSVSPTEVAPALNEPARRRSPSSAFSEAAQVVRARNATPAPPEASAIPQEPASAGGLFELPAVVEPPPVQIPPMELRLQGITFNGRKSSAIINGQTINLGEVMGKLRLLEIDTDKVTVDNDGVITELRFQ